MLNAGTSPNKRQRHAAEAQAHRYQDKYLFLFLSFWQNEPNFEVRCLNRTCQAPLSRQTRGATGRHTKRQRNYIIFMK
jgi:hypothetical protein